jgi:uncharacterized membrane protein YgdD (TMEM256/DUF423 family)
MHKKIYFWAALLGLLAVAIGAFGAHTLKTRLNAEDLQVIQTGVQYHFYHVFALFLTGLFYKSYRHSLLAYAAYCFGTGIFFFSFSLYIMKLTVLTTEGEEKWLGYFTPFGGLLFILGWLFLAIYFVKEREKNIKKRSITND